MNIANTTQVSTILIDGATGYIGSHLIYALQKSQSTKPIVRCLVRKTANTADIDFLKSSGASVFQADLNGNLLDTIFSQVDVACHLIGSIAPRRGETSTSLHIEQTEHFVQCCLKGKVKKIIMVSACGADEQAQSEYHRTKWQAERIIEQSGIPAIILQPSLVIGKKTGARNSKLIARLENLIRNKKFIPLIAGGKNRVQPLFIGDLVEAILACSLDTISTSNTPVLELGGPEILTLKELVQKMMNKIGITHPTIDLPIPAAIAAAHLAELTQEVPIISRDQIKLAQQDNICSNNQLNSLLKRSPTTLEDALNSYQWHSA